MFYCQKKDTYIRSYDGIAVITSIGVHKEKVFDEVGGVFLKALKREPQKIEELAETILKTFVGVDKETIIKDASEFYDSLVDADLLLKGESIEDMKNQNTGFVYSDVLPPKQNREFAEAIKPGVPTTQDFLEKHFEKHPHITSFQIELTSKCNERCIHCYIPHDLKLYDIKPELFYDVLNQCEKMGVTSVTLSGGEPMANPHFVEFLKAAKAKDFYVTVLSNLTLLNDEILKAMTEGNTSSVQVSLYSMNPEVHDYITQLPGSWEKTKNAILRLIENNVPVHVSCPTMKANKNDYMDVMKWCHEHKIRSQTDYIMMAQFNHKTDNLANRLSVEEAGEVIRQITLEDKNYTSVIMKPDFLNKVENMTNNPERRLCGIGVDSCCMVANGNVYPCAGWQEMVLGNLQEQTLEDIWKNSEKLNWLRSIRLKDLGKGKCTNCENSAFCAPCMVRNANESKSGDPLEINKHFCDVAAVNKKIVLDWRKQQIENMEN